MSSGFLGLNKSIALLAFDFKKLREFIDAQNESDKSSAELQERVADYQRYN